MLQHFLQHIVIRMIIENVYSKPTLLKKEDHMNEEATNMYVSALYSLSKVYERILNDNLTVVLF